MNPANFPNVGGGMPAGAKPHGQMQVPQKTENPQVVMNHVAQVLQSQGPFTGWRAEVPIKERAMKVYQMITSLRLITPQINLQNAAQAALSFEQKAFRDASQKADYDRECNEKLIHIRDTRARQAAVMQGGMMPQGVAAAGMGGVGQNQVQGSFPQQMNRPVQASPIPNQQQMSMGINDPSQQAAMQQQRQQQQQRAQQRPGTGVPLPDDLNTLAPQEYEHVCRLANQMLAKTSPEDMEKIKMNLQNMTPEQRQYLSRKNIEPMTYFFRSQALNQLRRHKRNRLEMARAQNVGMDPSGAMMGDPMMNAQQRQVFQNMMNMQRNQAFPMNGQQNLDPSSFIGNVENIQGQQADGLRSQEAGQLVVPASSSQMNQQPFGTPQGMFQVGQHLGQNGQSNGLNPQFLAQQHLQNVQNVQQDRVQQAAQLQAQSQAQARAQAAQKAQMAISSQAGQANSQMSQQLPQQSPAMPMLNRPMSGQMSPAQVAAQVRPPSRAPGMPGVQPLPGQPAMQNRPQIPPGLPPAIQEQLAHMSPEQINAFLMNHRRALATNQAQAMARANAAQQSMPMQQGMAQAGQGQQMANGQMTNNQNMRASINLQQQLAGMGGAQQSNQMLQGQQLSLQQRQQQQQQQQLYKLQLLRQQNGSMEMTQDQVREMDRVHFPPSILNNNPNMNSPVPKNIKTWGQLKQWAASNPQVLGGVDLPKLMTLQKLHYAQILAQGKDLGRSVEQNGQVPGMPMPAFQGQQPFMNSQPLQPGQQQAPMNMPAMRPITTNDIQMARQRLGVHVQNYTDDQLRELLLKNRQKQIMQAQTRAAAQAFAAQSMNQGQQGPASQQPQGAVPPSAPQMKQPLQQPQQQPPQPSQQAQTAKAQGAAAGKASKASAAKQASKKRPSSDEVVEIQNPNVQQLAQPAVSQAASGMAPSRPSLPISREQFAAMTPQQRLQVEAHLKKQQGRTSVTRAAAEEAWNHLPDQIKHLYADIAKNAPAPEPVALSPDQKATMSQQLRECTDMLGRMDTLVGWFAKIPNQEKNVRSILAMRLQLMRQFRPGPEWVLNDQLTIAPDYLNGTISYVKKLFQAMIARLNQQQNQPSAQRPGAPGPSAAQQPNQANMPPLNASNLQQLQQQEEALQRARRASSQAASTVPQPPFGAPSPQGVPHAYGPGGFPPEKLKLPPTKKRKQSHAGSAAATPVQGQGAAAKSQAAKQSAAEAKAIAASLAGPFKCSVAECQYHYQGFATQVALDKHVQESHKAEEPIENALEFALESLQKSLIKTEKTDTQETKKPSATALEVKQVPHKLGAATSPAKQDIKLEGATPVISGAIPMGRISSQIGPKSTSPASNQQTTPRLQSGKAPIPSTLKPSPSKEVSKETGKHTETMAIAEDAAAKDPWADSAISLEAIHDTFMDLGEDSLYGLGLDPIDEFLNTDDMFTKIQSKDTPDSVDTGVATQTPKDSDTSREEDMDIKIGGVPEESWIPVDWVNLPSRFEGSLLMNESWMDLDWENIDRKEAELNVDDGGIAIYAL